MRIIFGLEALAAAVLVFFRLFALWRGAGDRSKLWRSPLFFLLQLLLLFCLLVGWSQFSSAGRPVLGGDLLPPGSLLTRLLNVQLQAPLRRLIEPAWWLMLGLIAVLGFICRREKNGALFMIAAVLFWLSLVFDALFLFPALRAAAAELNLNGVLWAAHIVLLQGAQILLLLGLMSWFYPLRINFSVNLHLWRRVFSIVLGATALVLCLLPLVLREAPRRNALVGAHYYSWFPENWKGGFVGEKLTPPVLPLLGRYMSDDEVVYRQHLKWAKGAGINFFIFDWWSKRPSIRRRIEAQIQDRRLLDRFKFTIMYETLDLKEKAEQPLPGEAGNVVFMSRPRIEQLKKHWVYLARHYMGHPAYLRIEGRPVLFVYATRHLVGPVAGAIAEAREEVKKTAGFDLYLIADEVYFNVLAHSPAKGIFLRPEYTPEWERICAFDALTAYNPYSAEKKEFAGSAGAEHFLAEVQTLYRHYKGYAATVGIPFVPGVIPGYNDRGIRPAEDHYVVPRRLGRNGGESFFQAAFKKWGLQFIDSSTPMIAVTSWNEWNEGTQIEPAALSPVTRADTSPSGASYAANETYDGYGLEYLEKLSAMLTAFKKKARVD